MRITKSYRTLKNPFKSGFFNVALISWSFFYGLQLSIRFILSFNQYFKSLSYSQKLDAIYYGLKQDISISSYSTLLVLFFYAFFSIRITRRLTLGLSFFQIIIAVLDFNLLDYWQSKINTQVFYYLQFPNEVIANLNRYHLVVLSIIIGVFYFTFKHSYRCDIKFQSLEKKFDLGFFVILILLFVGIRGGFGKMPVLISDSMHSSDEKVNNLSLNSTFNFGYQFVEYFMFEDYPTEEFEKFNNGAGVVIKPSINDKIETIPQYPNIILIIMEGQTAELSKFYNGKDGNCMPFLDSISKQGFSCVNAFATGNRTIKGLASILFAWPGIYTNDLERQPSLFNKIQSLPEIMNAAGYETEFYYGGDANFNNVSGILKSNGINTIKDIKYWEENYSNSIKTTGSWGIHDMNLFELISKELTQKVNKPRFSIVLTSSAHEPFDICPNRNLNEFQKIKYAVNYADNSLKSFFSNLNSQVLNSSLFVITADHGKELGSENTFFGSRNQFHIPFLFYSKKLPLKYRNKVNFNIVSQVDIPKSICSLLGISNSLNNFSKSIFNEISNVAISHLENVILCHDSSKSTVIFTDKMANRKEFSKLDSVALSLECKILKEKSKLMKQK